MPEPEDEPEDLQECRTLENIRFVKIGRGHFRVFSRSQPEIAYDVDLHTYGGLGSCSCPDFTARRKVRWRSVRKNYDCFRCVHLRAMRNVTLDAIIAFYAKREQEQQ